MLDFIYRMVKGSPLTWSELDGNFRKIADQSVTKEDLAAPQASASIGYRPSGASASTTVQEALDQNAQTSVQLVGRLDNAILSFPDYASAEAAAATLPDGQEIEAPNADGRISRFVVQSSALAFKDFAPDAIQLQSYTELRAYTGKAQAIDITSPGVAGRFNRDDVDTATPDNGGTVIVDGLGRRWKRLYSGVLRFEWFGATGDGVTLDDAAFTAAIAYAISIPGAEIAGQPGARYAISQPITVPFDGKFQDISSRLKLDFSGTTIIPKTNNQIALKLCRDFVHALNPTVETTATGVIAYYVGPADEGVLSSIVSQQFCLIENPKAKGARVGVKQIPGASVGGQNSGSYYNSYVNPIFTDVELAFWLAGNPKALDNQNTRTNIVNPKHLRGNCTFLIECADSVNVFGGSAEFINQGTYPLATATCIKIPARFAGHTLDNRAITFWGFTGETLSMPYAVESYDTAFPGCHFSNYTVKPLVPLTPDATALLMTLDNPGAIRSVSDVTGKAALLGMKIVGGNQAFMSLENGAVAKFYSDTGFKTYSRFDIDNLTTTSASQNLGTYAAPVYLTGGSGICSYRLVNTGALEFGNTTSVRTTSDNEATLGTAAKRWGQIYSTTSTISTSDGREKTHLVSIDDALLDAWGDVRIGAFKWLSAVASKGDAARFHTGVIAQDVRDALIAHGLMSVDSTDSPWGGLCYDEWPESPAVLDDECNELLPAQQAGSRWGIRADQCLFLEAAYQRRRADRIEKRLSAIEAKLQTMS